jgi:hypothetical protein
MHVFLARPFDEDVQDLVRQIDRLLASHNIRAVSGERAGGGALDDVIFRRIKSCNALVALVTKRADGGPSQWVVEELNYARAHEKPAIPLVETGVQLGGAYAGWEQIPLDVENPTEALVRLSETLALWKARVGLARRVQLTPDSIGQQFRRSPGLKCKYRVVEPNGDRGDWQPAPDPIAQGGGTLVYLEGIGSDEHYIEVEVMNGDTREWYSDTTPQLITVAMHEAS